MQQLQHYKTELERATGYIDDAIAERMLMIQDGVSPEEYETREEAAGDCILAAQAIVNNLQNIL